MPETRRRFCRFLRLIDGLLQAGYLEDWRYHQTLSGCPQGGVVSPVLSNIYLDRLDTYLAQTCYLPTTGEHDARLIGHICGCGSALGDWNSKETGRLGHALRKQMKTMPSRDPNDPSYRRLRYCRYADDWLLGFAGPGRKPSRSRLRSVRSCMMS